MQCPVCHGEGGFDISYMNAPVERLCREVGLPFVPAGILPCDVCEGTGEATEEAIRDWEAWSAARYDQLKAGIASGEIKV